MSMSTCVMGFRPPDEKYEQMKEIWLACKKAKVEIPEEVSDFFEDMDPDDAGIKVGLSKECCREYSGDMEEGYEVDITKLPKDVKIIRFVNSW